MKTRLKNYETWLAVFIKRTVLPGSSKNECLLLVPLSNPLFAVYLFEKVLRRQAFSRKCLFSRSLDCTARLKEI